MSMKRAFSGLGTAIAPALIVLTSIVVAPVSAMATTAPKVSTTAKVTKTTKTTPVATPKKTMKKSVGDRTGGPNSPTIQ